MARSCPPTWPGIARPRSPLDGPGRAITWARAAAEVERARLGFAEAAAHLARARRAIEASGDDQAGGPLVDLLVEEADARVRAGDPPGARGLLDDAARRAAALDDAERLGQVALGVQRLGARFAMPRDAVIDRLDDRPSRARWQQHRAGGAAHRQLGPGADPFHPRAPRAGRAAVGARPRGGPRATMTRPPWRPACSPATTCCGPPVGRPSGSTSPGRSPTWPTRTGDPERRAEGLLLTANALLEQGSAAFRAAWPSTSTSAEGFGQPRHDYLALTRRAALALIDGRLDEAEQLIDEAGALGERIGEPDTENVRTGQMLELARARGEPDRLRAAAAAAIRCWVGVPSHAHAVAAGLLARAGEPDDLDAARRALDTATATERVARRPLLPVVAVRRRVGDRRGPTGRPGTVRPAARRAGTAHRHLRRRRLPGLLRRQQRALGRDRRRGAGASRAMPTAGSTRR